MVQKGVTVPKDRNPNFRVSVVFFLVFQIEFKSVTPR